MALKQKFKQLALPGLKRPVESEHGGEHAKGKRKARRPFDPKQALHVVLRSSHARGEHSMLHPRHCNHVRGLADRLARRWNVKIYRFANVGNHLHLLIRAKSRSDWHGFIRALAGGIAMLVTGARKGHALARSEAARLRAFWDHLVYTRIVKWGRDFESVAQYVCKNLWEGMGIPVQRLLQRGYRVLEISEDGAILATAHASSELNRAEALEPG